jgi:eukaryotic-like serine/threonine-protein kinase
MSLCINPTCSRPHNSDERLFCQSCGSEVLLEGRYRVVSILGEGGCGKTYEVSDRDGAAKVLKVLSRNEPKHVELFQREAQVLTQLRHPGIPAVEPNAYFTYLSKGAVESIHCLVMEKVTGLDLQKYLRQRGSPIDQVLAVQWLIQLSRILKAVHSQQFLHRDIKPSNIMLKADGHLVLIDFGTARTITHVSSFGEPSTQATRIMSALYTPLEQMKGKPVPQSDFFALGRTFVYLLTGQDLGDLYNAESDTLDWRGSAPHLSIRLADFLDQLMAPFIGQRPVDADAMLQQLMDIQRQFYTNSAILTPTQFGDAPTQLADHRHLQPLPPPSSPLPQSSPLPPSSPLPASSPLPVSSPPPPSPAPAPLSLSPELLERCKRELAELIGPIASIVCQRTLTQAPQLSEREFVEAIARQISNARDAEVFRQRLRI